MQQDADREVGLKSHSDDELEKALSSAKAYQKEVQQLHEVRSGLVEEKEALCNQVVRLQAALGDKDKQDKLYQDQIAQLTSRLGEAVAGSTNMEGQRNRTSRESDAMRRRAEEAEAAAAQTEKKAADLAHVFDQFDHLIESSKLGIRKPDPRIYALMCEALEVDPSDCVYLDDLGINLKPARAMGMTTIKVLGEDQLLDDLKSATGYAVV